jgi:D-alanyl-D-alanine carboxypeptidase/D-alanyl-D-alanine-endopeptidase (penicillin-binding protein 4)
MERALVTEDVPEAADRVDEAFREFGIDLFAELFDVDVDGVWFDVFVEASPHGFDDSASGDGAIGAAHEEFEEAEFGGSEGDGFAVASDIAGGGIEAEVSRAEFWNGRLGGTACDGTEAGEEDVEGEGFDEVIVGPGVEAGNDVVWGIAGGEHEDGGAVFVGAEATGDFEAGVAGHHDVEDDGVEVSDGKGGEGFFAVAGEGDGVVLFLEALGEEVSHGWFVFGDEEEHGELGRRGLRLGAQKGDTAATCDA